MKRQKVELFEGLEVVPTPICWPPRVGHERLKPRDKTRFRAQTLHAKLVKRHALREELWQLQFGRCWWCARLMSREPYHITLYGNRKGNKKYATFEHLKPRHAKGDGSRKNLRLAHQGCNEKRHRTNKPEWLAKLEENMYCWEAFKLRVAAVAYSAGDCTCFGPFCQGPDGGCRGGDTVPALRNGCRVSAVEDRLPGLVSFAPMQPYQARSSVRLTRISFVAFGGRAFRMLSCFREDDEASGLT